MMKRPLLHILPVIAALLWLGTSCSTRKNTATTRFWQAFNTRYNVYYNGATHYDEQIKILEGYQDDYSKTLLIHPAEARADIHNKLPQPGGDFKRTIDKMQKAISLHSIKKKPRRGSGRTTEKQKQWLKREEYNPFLHNAWELLGRAEYMSGDFLASAATFHYISRHFQWLPATVTEAKLWEALSYCAMGWATEADNILTYMHPEKFTSKRQHYLYNLALADYHILEHHPDQAITPLAAAARHSSGPQKTRLHFLLGQLYTATGNKAGAYKAFGVAGSGTGSTYYTKLNARLRQSAVFDGKNINGEVRKLRRMTRFDRNKEYLDQIYYAIGNLYLGKGDTARAVTNYTLAVERSTRQGIDKAIAQLALGAIHFARRDYDQAQPCYSQALPALSNDYPDYKTLRRRSDVLDELAVYSQNVHLQDSLLRLSEKSPEEQRKVIAKIIDELKKREKQERDEQEMQERLANNQSLATNQRGGAATAPATFGLNDDKSWYFYNRAAKAAGKTQFQRLWGNRRLEDDWRRRNKAMFSLNAGDEDTEATGSDTAPADTTQLTEQQRKQAATELERENDPHYEQYYLKQIPKTDDDRATCHDIIQEGRYNMGIILKDKLEDMPAAVAEFTTLLRDYPDNVYRLDTYYNLYLLYMRHGLTAEAEQYRQLILQHFADSKYGHAMQDPAYLDNLRAMGQVQEQNYAQAYSDYLDNRNDRVHQAYEQMQRQYPMSELMPKFMFLHALAYVTDGDEAGFSATLKQLLERYPDTDLTPTASAMLKSLNAGRHIRSSASGTNKRGLLWATHLSQNDSTAASTTQVTPFSTDTDTPQYLLLAYPTDTVSANQLLYDVAYHNFTTFVVKDYDLEQMTFGALGILLVKGFANAGEVSHYRTILEDGMRGKLPPQVRLVTISQDNFAILLREGRSLQEYFRFSEEQLLQRVEQKADDTAPDDTP